MKKSILFLCLSLPLFAETGFLAQQAELAWQNRDKPGETEQAIQTWELAIKAEPGRGDLWIRLAAAMGRAVRHSSKAAERKNWADRARAAGEKAVAKNPQSSDAHAVYGEALGQWADTHKGVHSLVAVRQAVGMLNTAIELNPKNAYAHMLLASFYREAPGVISVGNNAKALEQAKLAVSLGPTYAINHLVLAKVYLDHGRKTDAISELQTTLNLAPPADAIPETLADQETARTMLKNLGITPPPMPSASCGETGLSCTEPKP